MTAPHVLSSLQTLGRKVKMLAVLTGLGWVLAVAVTVVIGVVGLDYLLNLWGGARAVLLIIGAAVLAHGLWHWVFKGLFARMPLSALAGRVEEAFPQFADRLRSTVQFTEEDEVAGSAAMRQQVIAQTETMTREIGIDQAVQWYPVYKALGTGIAGVLILLLVAILVGPVYQSIAIARLVNPFGPAVWPKRSQIALVGEVPQRVPAGQRVQLKMKLSRGDRPTASALVRYQLDDGSLRQEYMTRRDDGVYTASLDAKAAGLLKASIRAGDDEQILPSIAIVPRLQILQATATVTPPNYTKLPAGTTDLATGPAAMVAGSEVWLNVKFNKQLSVDPRVRMEVVNGAAGMPTRGSELGLEAGATGGLATTQAHSTTQPTWSSGDPSRVMGRMTAERSLRFHVRAVDVDGFENLGTEEYELIVRPDQNPSVQIENPRRSEQRTAVSLIPLQAIVEDDFGVQSLLLQVERIGDKKQWTIPLVEETAAKTGVSWIRQDQAAQRMRFGAEYGWELAELPQAELKPGDVLEYYLEVRDNFYLNGKRHDPVASGRLRVSIISQEDLVARITEELRAVAYQVTEARNTQNRLKQETNDFKQDTQKKSALDAGDRQIADRLSSQQGMVASQTAQIAGRLEVLKRQLDENRSPSEELGERVGDVQKELTATAENPMKEATRNLSAAQQPKQPPETRDQNLVKANEAQDQAVGRLQKALDRLGEVGSLQQTIQSIRSLLADQQKVSKQTAEAGKGNLGKRPDQLSSEDRQKLEKASAEQESLAQRTQRALEEMQKMGQQLAKSDPAAAEAMKQAAQMGKQQQIPGSQSRAAQAAKQNQQSSAQAAQKQAELGLEMILSELRAVEKHKLEELAKKLADLQQQLERLIRRQAGHNLDDLMLQGAAVVGKTDPKLMESLLTRAQRDLKDDPGTLPQLSQSQEQTERNTRDLSKSIEQGQGGEEAGSHLLKASGRMERAAVALREQKLAEAYDPPQVEALAELEQAKQHVDQQKQKVDQQIEQQQQEAIRQQLVKIREEQQKVNQDTVKVDKAPRLSDGTFKREDLLRLGQLPTEQKSLAERTEKLAEPLGDLGSIVYVWAVRDVVQDMGRVKEELSKQQTGKLIQSRQSTILDQLDAMIRNLAIEPPEPEKFADRQGDGGGGGGGQKPPALPGEIELRLLKDLQQGVNRHTKVVDAQETKDPQQLQPIGLRQGELRSLLDEMIKKASAGKLGLGKEPENKNTLPEESTPGAVSVDPLDQELLNSGEAKESSDRAIDLVGTRMARSRQRVALNNDPGKTTQQVQERILKGLDELIAMARKQQAQNSSSSSASGQQAQAKKPSSAKPGNQGQPPGQQQPGGSSPAQSSNTSADNGAAGNSDTDIRQTMKEWGGITPRQREAIIEGAGETIIEKYRSLIEDYYKSLATKQAQEQR